MEDMERSVRADVQQRATPVMRQLLALDYPYPAVLDEAEAVNLEGATAATDGSKAGKGYGKAKKPAGGNEYGK